MRKLTMILMAAAASIAAADEAHAQYDRDFHMPEMNIEGSLGNREPRGNERGGPDRGGDRGVAARPPEDRGYVPPRTLQPIPLSGDEPGLVVYEDGSMDLLDYDPETDTYTLDRYDRYGNRIGGEQGTFSGYVRSGAPLQMNFLPPPPIMVSTCYTPAGGIRVNSLMVLGQSCMAITPWGTFYGAAGV